MQEPEEVAVDTKPETEDGVKWVRETKVKRKQEERLDRLFYSLDLSIRKRGRIQIMDFDNVFHLIRSLKFCSSSQAVLLLKCCGEVLVDEDRQVRTGLVEKCLRLLRKIQGLDLDIAHYNTLLKVWRSPCLILPGNNVPLYRFTWRMRILSISRTSWLLWTETK